MNIVIRKASVEDKFGVARLIIRSFESFEDFVPSRLIASSVLEHGFNENDLVMTVDGNMIGYHFLSEDSISCFDAEELADEYKDMKGLRGFVFCIHPGFQRMGLGSRFMGFERIHFRGKYDYIWGGADDRLNNIDFWKKNRDLTKESSSYNNKTRGSVSILKLF